MRFALDKQKIYVIGLVALPAVITLLIVLQLAAKQAACHDALSPKQLECGSSRDEALQAGCIFDLMSFTWTHKDCHDADLEVEFLSRRAWKWYLDREGTATADEKRVREGQFPSLHVTWEYHRLHCVYMMRKMARATEAERPLDSYIMDLGHTRHCLGQLEVQGTKLWSVNTEIRVKFPRCIGLE
ncbi:hypothetical protein ARSEF1564_003344 [Beauveria bassiana]